jgi:hypothetical protein
MSNPAGIISFDKVGRPASERDFTVLFLAVGGPILAAFRCRMDYFGVSYAGKRSAVCDERP